MMMVHSANVSLPCVIRLSPMQALLPKHSIISYNPGLGFSQFSRFSNITSLLSSTSSTRLRFSLQEPDAPPLDKLQREFDSVFLRFLEEDVPTKILGEEDAGQEITQTSEQANVEEVEADPIRRFFKCRTGQRLDPRQEGAVHRRLNRSSTWQFRESRANENIINNTTVPQNPGEGVKPAELEADPETEEQDLLKSIIDIAKNLPVNTMLADFLDPYVGRLGQRDCNSLLQVLGEEGLCLQALYLLEWMGLQEPSMVTPRTYSIVFPLLGKAGMADRLLVLSKNMPMGREFHCVNVYNALISGLSRCGSKDEGGMSDLRE